MKLTFKDEFTIEYEDKTFSGEFTELTRKQIKEFNKKYHKNDEIESDEVFKARLELSIISDSKQEIMSLGQLYNYKAVFDTIVKSISEIKAKN